MENIVDHPPSAASEAAPAPSPGGRIRKYAKGAGFVVLGLVALDLVATVATLAFGAGMLRR